MNVNKYRTKKASCIEQGTAGGRNVSPQELYMMPVASSLSIRESIKDVNMIKPQF